MMVVGKNTKSIIVVFVWLLVGIAFVFTLFQILNPGELTVDKILYNSHMTSTMNYNVRLKDTPVHESEQYADPSKYYIMPFTDYLAVNCEYQFNGSSDATVAANDYVTAFLVSYINEGNEEIVLWKKEYTLADAQTSEATGTEFSGTRTIKIEFDEYVNLLDRIEEEYKFRSEYYLLVVYTTEFDVTYGDANEKRILQPHIKINMEDLLFGIEANSPTAANIELIQQQVVEDEINWDYVIIGGTIFVLLAVFALLIPTKLISSIPLSEEARAIKRITVKYGDRIVKIVDKPVISESTVKLESIDDVMKIADEIAQPIFSVSIDNETYFYVNNNGVIYYISINTK